MNNRRLFCAIAFGLAGSAALTAAPFLSPLGLPGVGELGGPWRPLDSAEMARFLNGRAVFDRDFHRSDGVGTPEMNADSCRACHQDPILGGAGGLELNVSRFGFNNGGQGPFQDVTGGQGLSRLRPPWVDGREEYDPLTADVSEQRQTPSSFGLGLIESIPDAEIISNEDPNDLNGDGIRGVARRLTINNQIEVGRFGWKAQVPRVGDFMRDAMAGECGITTIDDGRGFAMTSDMDSVADPELSQTDLDDLTFFVELLAGPPRVGSQAPGVLQGEQLFLTIGCARCHIPTLNGTGQAVNLYSDLLLHDVMGRDYRGMSEPGAPSGSFRTPPLWGIRHTAPYMHDGRAATLPDAVEAHKGTASRVIAAYNQLTPPQKRTLFAFLGDL